MSLSALRRFLERSPPAAAERCDLCGAAIAAEHGHMLNVETRRLSCACRACALLFEPRGAGGGKMRVVPSRYRRLDALELDWARLNIPVRTAFFVGAVAFYPSPAGATEAPLPPDAW